MAIVTITVKQSNAAQSTREEFVSQPPLDIHDRINAFFNEIKRPSTAAEPKPDTKPAIDWQEAVLTIDRFRDCISSYYGFKRDLIKPVFIADPKSPTADCAFDVMGIGYELHRGKLTCTGEVKPYER